MVDDLGRSGDIASRPRLPGAFDRDPYIYGIRALNSGQACDLTVLGG